MVQVWNDPMCGNVTRYPRGPRDHSTLQVIIMSVVFFCCVCTWWFTPLDHNSDSLSSGSRIMRRLHVFGLDQLVRYPLALAPDWYRVAWAQHQKNIRGLPTWQGALQKVKP